MVEKIIFQRFIPREGEEGGGRGGKKLIEVKVNQSVNKRRRRGRRKEEEISKNK